MESKVAADLLASLALEARLEAFRLLVKAGPEGLKAGDIAAALGAHASTLSANLAVLSHAGLIEGRREGRAIYYRARYDRMRDLMAYLVEDCCNGAPEVCGPLVEIAGQPDFSNSPGERSSPMHSTSQFNILFLCTGNSARSILAECIMNRVGAGKFRAYSAGSHPKGEVHPGALRLLQRLGYDVSVLRSKSWDEFAQPGAPHLHFVVTVCDNAAGELCPIWPGQPITSHWGMPDPAAVAGSDAQTALAFSEAYRQLHNRISIFAALPVEKLKGLAIKEEMDALGAPPRYIRSADGLSRLHPGDPGDEALVAAFVSWLTQAGLPTSDLTDDFPTYYVLKDEADAPLAFGGVAGGGSDRLLRSIVVDPQRRGAGAGPKLVAGLESVARQAGAARLWLLTENAAAAFEAMGWRRVERREAPAGIQATSQFQTLCPADAVLMRRDLA